MDASSCRLWKVKRVYYPFLCLVQWFSVISSNRLVVTAQKFLSVSLCAIFLSAIKLFTITISTQRIIFGSSYAELIILPFRYSHRLGNPFSWPAPNSRLLSSENPSISNGSVTSEDHRSKTQHTLCIMHIYCNIPVSKLSYSASGV
jgi:hypothetical protein